MNSVSRCLLGPILFFTFSCAAANVSLDHELSAVQGNITNPQQVVGEKPLYLKFWATWCQPCIKEMPHLQHTQDTLGQDIQVMAINIDLNESDQAIAKVMEKFGLTMPVLRDHQGELANALQFSGTPYHVLVDKDGEILHQGHAADETLDRKLALLAANQSSDLPHLTLESQESEHQFSFNTEGPHVLFFTATWCDWYLQDSRPQMSQACATAQKGVGEMSFPADISMTHVVSHMWTGDEDVEAYRQKYHINHQVLIDHHGDGFFSYKIRQLPTMLIINHGAIAQRSSDPSEILAMLNDLQNPN